MFERNMVMRVFVLIMLVMLGLPFLILGFLLPDILSNVGVYNTAIDSFNYILLYLLLFDFTAKYLLKESQTMHIVPYLTLPIKRYKLFNFLLIKEFSNTWNLYLLFCLIPFAFRAIPLYYGYSGVVLFILFLYLLFVVNSFLVNVFNMLLDRNEWYRFLPIIIVGAIVGVTFIPGVNIEDGIVNVCKYILEKEFIVWMILVLIFFMLWKVNLSMINAEVYRAMQGNKISDAKTFILPFTNKLGRFAMFMNLELKMILRSKRLKSLPYFIIIIPIFYSAALFLPFMRVDSFNMLFLTMYTFGWIGIGLCPLIFTYESSFFDGLMTRSLSLLDILKSKYIFYISGSILVFLLNLMILAFTDFVDFLYLISVFFYTIGVIYFFLFQNAVYNKKFYDHSDSTFINLNNASGSSFLILLISLIAPYSIVGIVSLIFDTTIACYFMLITGFIFTITANYWLRWTYNRFLKRKYKNMEGFRANN